MIIGMYAHDRIDPIRVYNICKCRPYKTAML